ncbi:hypothetical protein F905_01367 [Acinetobacter sp. CIP 53.82]|nr:hypothetical protein F905_01367 [Acinetobacter sp. CIP 53.82]
MGMLIAKCYPTKLFLKAADHTYVTCGKSGKSWGCWGGKQGGTELTIGQGSTKRADTIAEPNERAGIKRYLIDGVCHQAANRILLPAKILVSQARGYRLSSAVFGTYGKSPFNQYPDISGDLPACDTGENIHSIKEEITFSKNENLKIISANLEIYNKYAKKSLLTSNNLEEFSNNFFNMQIEIFTEEVKIWVGEYISSQQLLALQKAKESLEHKLLIQDSSLLLSNSISMPEFIRSFEKVTNEFQSDIADILSDFEYAQLLQLNRNERLSLIDPLSIDIAFGEGTYKKAFPES